jgi:hypothetical protein
MAADAPHYAPWNQKRRGAGKSSRRSSIHQKLVAAASEHLDKSGIL